MLSISTTSQVSDAFRGWWDWPRSHLGIFGVEPALTLSGAKFAAGERHGFKHALVLKRRRGEDFFALTDSSGVFSIVAVRFGMRSLN